MPLLSPRAARLLEDLDVLVVEELLAELPQEHLLVPLRVAVDHHHLLNRVDCACAGRSGRQLESVGAG